MQVSTPKAVGVTVLAIAAGALAAAAPAPALPGLELRTVPTPMNSVGAKAVTAWCSPGKRVIGTGITLSGAAGQVMIGGMVPGSASVASRAREDGTGFSGNWLVRATAICAAPPAGHQVVAATSPSSSAFSHSATAVCPAGKKVLGTGALLVGGQGQVVIDEVRPNSALQSVLVTGYEDDDGYAGNWSVRAYAVCAFPPAGLHLASATNAASSPAFKDITTVCAHGTRLHGVGGEITGGLGQVSFDDLPRDTSLEFLRVTASEDEDGTAADWSLTAYAICAA